jgi:CDP-diacylglycerol--glycerol-3-phosphate 3-phosphatidyltransferase
MDFSLIPNVLSALRIVLTPLCMYFLMRGGGEVIYSLVLFCILALSDFYDGYIARKYHFESRSGSFLDPLADKALVLGVLSAFCVLEVISIWVVIIVALRDLVITCLRSAIIVRGGLFVTSRLAKWKTTVQYALLCVLYADVVSKFIGSYGFFDPYVYADAFALCVSGVVYFALFITVYSGFDYFVQNAQELKNFSR